MMFRTIVLSLFSCFLFLGINFAKPKKHKKQKEVPVQVEAPKIDSIVTVKPEVVPEPNQPSVIIVDNFTETTEDSILSQNDFKLDQKSEKIDERYKIAVDLKEQKILIHNAQFDSLSNFFYVMFSDKNGKIMINSKLNKNQPDMEINLKNVKQSVYVLNIIDADFSISNLYLFRREK